MGTAGDSQRVSAPTVYSVDAENPRNSTKGDDIPRPKTWKSYIWDTWDLPPDQRWMLFKVDAFVLTFASLGYFLKNIDQTNVNNAFLSGMKEDLGMYGNELVTSMCFLLLEDIPASANKRSQARLSGLSDTSSVKFHPTCC
jgi:ACS family pantothenate transporter-like MFS transporter